MSTKPTSYLFENRRRYLQRIRQFPVKFENLACTGWAKEVIPLVHILHCTRGITFLAHPGIGIVTAVKKIQLKVKFLRCSASSALLKIG